MRLYLSGPMTGVPLWNWPAFELGTADLRAKGYEVVSPAEIDERLGLVIVTRRLGPDDRYDVETGDVVFGEVRGPITGVELAVEFDWKEAIARDLAEIDECDGIATLDGWEDSLGARIEVDRAKASGKPVFDVDTWLALGVPVDCPGCTGDPVDHPQPGAFHPEPVEATLPRVVVDGGVRDRIVESAQVRADLGLPPEPVEATLPPLSEWFPPAPAERGVNPKDLVGDTKPQMHLVPPSAIVRMAKVFELGARKYGPYNWRENAVRFAVYIAAAQRHLAALLDGETIDPESGQPHAAHVAAGMAIVLDADATGNLVDDRPILGAAADLIRSLS